LGSKSAFSSHKTQYLQKQTVKIAATAAAAAVPKIGM
jgi:hypothetical protein